MCNCWYLQLFCYIVGHCSQIENDDGNDVIYEYDFGDGDATLDRKSPAISREFPRRRSRFRRDSATDGDYQYDDDSDDLMTSGATSSVNNSISDASSHRQMSLPTDPEVKHVLLYGC